MYFTKKIWLNFIIFKYFLGNSEKNSINFHITLFKLCKFKLRLTSFQQRFYSLNVAKVVLISLGP